MGDQSENTAFAVVKSLTGWWELAGLDSAVSELPVNWLADEAPGNAPVPSTITLAAQKNSLHAEPSIAWPLDIAALREMVKDGAHLPGNTYAPVRFAPVGPDACNVMIISDLPDILDSQDSTSAANTALLRRMMGAIGVDLADCYCTWLATTLPPTGEVPESDLPELAGFILHQIKLIRPKSIVLLGSAACRALLNDELMNARVELRNINHDSVNIQTLSTFHPRTLIARPAMKAQAWRDLQMFAKGRSGEQQVA